MSYGLSPATVWGSGQELPSVVIQQQTEDHYTIGAYVYGTTISAPFPTSQQECTSDPLSVTIGVTSSANATCRYSAKGVDTCATAVANLDTEFSATGARTTHTHVGLTQACGGSTDYVVKCQDDATSLESNCLEITIDAAAAGGGTPQPSPGMIVAPGNLTIIGGGNLLIH